MFGARAPLLKKIFNQLSKINYSHKNDNCIMHNSSYYWVTLIAGTLPAQLINVPVCEILHSPCSTILLVQCTCAAIGTPASLTREANKNQTKPLNQH